MDQDDEALIDAYRHGDTEALVILITKYFDSVYAYIVRLVGSHSEAEDIVQETFIKVWKQIDHFKPGLGLRPWLFRIARNTAIDHLRKKKNIPFSAFGEENEVTFVDTEVNLLEQSINQENKQALEEAIAELKPSYREVIILRSQEGLTFDEISKTLDKPLNTVKSLYRRGLTLLQQILVDHAPNKSPFS